MNMKHKSGVSTGRIGPTQKPKMIPEESNVSISSDDDEMSEDGYETVEEEENDEDDSGEDDSDDDGRENGDEGDDNDKESSDGSESKGPGGNAGWADAMNKILNVKKPLKKKTIVLAKAKRLTTMKIKEEPTNEETDEKKPSLKILDKKREQIVKGRMKPNILEKDKEKALARIATKGVVQLFNAVNIHKKGDSDESGESKKKKARVTELNKKQFLNMLQGEKEIKTEDEDDEDDELEIKDETENDWDVLKENFLTNTKLKNWDKAGSAV